MGRGTREDAAHLADVPDGCGCAEVWEHLSSQREADAEEEPERGDDRGPAPTADE